MQQLIAAAALRHWQVSATDGALGRLDDLLFDASWQVRHLAVATGGWLKRERVLIAPQAVADLDPRQGRITLGLARDSVSHSPTPPEGEPLSRHYEQRIFQHYGWPPYWGDTLFPWPSRVPGHDGGPAPPEGRADAGAAAPVLQALGELHGWHIEALDGALGHVEDALVELDAWAIRYLVIDTRNWWPGKHVLVAPAWIEGLGWHERKVYVDLPRSAIRSAPAYDPAAPLTRDDEVRLYAHYGRRQYWS